MTFVYGAPQRENRAEFWEKLTLLGASKVSAWILSGDFNDILDNSEKVGGPPRHEGSFLNFRSFVSQMGIWDVKHTGNHLSWRGMRYTHFVRSRLDRSLANAAWSESFPSGWCHYLRFEGSDHRPLITHFDTSRLKRKKLFRFDSRLQGNPEIRQLIADAWTSPSLTSVKSKINTCRRHIIQWTKDQHKNSSQQIKDKQEALEAALSADIPDPSLISSLSLGLEKDYKEEELFWRQRSLILWLQSGDRNTGFFHATTRGRRSRNRLTVIEDDNGVAAHEEDQITKTITDYFNKIFKANESNDLQILDDISLPMVSQEMNDALRATPSLDEIRRAVFDIHPDKAPGPDGFSAGFFRAYWDVIGADISKEIQSFFETGAFPANLNDTHVCLIPKGIGSKKVSDYRPIALCNVSYKIIAKILTHRLQPLLHLLISEHQSAFVSGRAITDNVLITHEILHFLRISKAKKRCSMAVKTDMSKAYDRIEWTFLRAVLEKMNFH